MPHDNSNRSVLIRVIRNQWLKDIAEMKQRILSFIPTYAEGSNSNQSQAVKLETIYHILEEVERSLYFLLEEL